MKRFLATTTILALSAGFASAEAHSNTSVTLSGDARMGIISDFGGADTAFTSRARVKFTLSGESDSGFSFGASFRADNAGGAAGGTAGSVYMSTGGFKLSMGDVDGAGAAAVGQVDGVGLTGLGDLNEIAYLSNGGTDTNAGGVVDTGDPSALVEYAAGDATIYFGVTNPAGTPSGEEVVAYGLGVKYAAGNFTIGAAIEQTTGDEFGAERSNQHIALGVDATLGAVVLKARYGTYSGDIGFGAESSGDQYAMSATYTADALSVTAFYANGEDVVNAPASGIEAFGIGASYDLGGGASVVGGYVADQTNDDSAFDLGLSFSF